MKTKGHPLHRIRGAGALVGWLAFGAAGYGAVDALAPDPRLPGVFDTELTQTESPHHLRFILRPHFGDLVRHDHLRVPIGVRYGLGQTTEASAEAEAYVAHGLGAVKVGSRFGLAGLRLAAKQRLPAWAWFGENAVALGLSYRLPVGSPPEEITDGRRHLSPFVTVTRPVPGWPRLTGFASAAADFTARTAFRGVRNRNTLLDDSLSLTSGLVWRGAGVTGTLETTFATNAFGAKENGTVVTVRPGMSWRLPNSRWLRPDGRWTVGLAPRVSFGPDGTDFGFGVKLRGDFDFRKWMPLPRK
ncbi:MAG: hypothetical protein JNL39_02650 [Opitutaceae bacterium]|nr:hypothetical protein [Opitutaceae bacterium]